VVDGTTSTTVESLHEVSETVHLYNPSMVGCKIVILLHTQLLAQKVQREENYFPYMAPGESFRGINAVRLLSKEAK
jgi:hypothetical protein